MSEKEKQEQAKREQEQAEFLLGTLRTEPNGLEKRDASTPTIPYKPGHWTSATLVAQASRENLDGRIETVPLALPGTPYRLGAERNAVLAKGEARQFEFTFFPPAGQQDADGRERSSLESELTTASGRMLVNRHDVLSPMPAYQYFFVVLAAEPDRYSFFRRLDSVRAPSEGLDSEFDMHYRVLLPNVKMHVPLPSSSLCWTSTAFLLWDRFDPARLTPDQKTALVDWLHWGGQLIVSGPDTLDVLAAGFLKPYVPADPGGTVLWTAGDLSRLTVDDWEMEGPKLTDDREWTGVELQPRTEGVTLVTSGDRPMIVERRVGRGRIVATAFSLTEPELRAWPKFDTLFNAALLRRPARRFVLVKGMDVATDLLEEVQGANDAEKAKDEFEQDTFLVEWADGHPRDDAARTSRVRIFSRDSSARAPLDGSAEVQHGVEAPLTSGMPGYAPPATRYGSGVAGWNSRSSLTNSVAQVLTDAAGITIPEATFVVKVMALYLAVLVPLNWLVFRVLGRVEWAWVAMPLLSIAFTVLVVRWAQLDIGFVRSETDVAVVELYDGYDRAHVTHYSVLYTSLATRFAAVFEGTAVVQPLPREKGAFDGLGSDDLVLAQGTTTRLTGFTVASNSTGMLHGEQMQNVGGALRVGRAAAGGWQVTNETSLTIRGAGVLSAEGAAWIGELAPGAGAVLKFAPFDPATLWQAELDGSPETDESAAPGSLNVRRLYRMNADDFAQTFAGMRLIGWTDAGPSGMSIEPAVSQQRKMAFVVAHLQTPELSRPADDIGTPHLPIDDQAEPEMDPSENPASASSPPAANAATQSTAASAGGMP